MQEVRGMFTRILGKYIKTSDATEIFETGNQCKSSQVVTGMTALERTQEPLSPRRTQITKDPKQDPINEEPVEDPKEDAITEDPKEDPKEAIITEDPRTL